MRKYIVSFLLMMVLCSAYTQDAYGEAGKYDFKDMSLNRVESRAFYGDTALQSVYLPETLTYIGAEAFSGCSDLMLVRCNALNTVIEPDAFELDSPIDFECRLGSTFDAYARANGMPRRYTNALEICSDTEFNGVKGLPITWTLNNIMPGESVKSTFEYELLLNGKVVYESGVTESTKLCYTPETFGLFQLNVTINNALTTSRITSSVVPVKETLLLGTFEQDKKSDTQDQIEWQILTVDGDKAFVISRYILKNGSYFNPSWVKYKYCTWNGSIIGTAEPVNYLGNTNGKKISVTPTTVPLKGGAVGTDDDLYYVHARYWLNEEFYHTAFTDAERTRILLTTNTNPDSPAGVEGGPDTQDYVFFLSMDELLTYFPDKKSRAAVMTPAAASELKKGKPHYYWLRTNGKFRCNAMYVYAKDGGYSSYGSDVGHDDLGYRPAMWITIGG